MDLPLDLPHSLYVLLRQIGIDRIGQPADQQILAEQIHYLVVRRLVQRLQCLKPPAHSGDGKFIQPIRIQELLKIQGEHLDLSDAAHGNGGGLRQRDAQQRAACDIGEPAVLSQKLEHGEQVRIGLDLIQENQRIFLFLHPVAGEHTHLKVEVLHRPDVGKQPGAQRVLHQVDLDVVLKQLLSHIADNVGLAHLTGAVNEQDLVRVRLQMCLDQRRYFSVKHTAPPDEQIFQ